VSTLETIHVRFAGEDLRSLIDLIRTSVDAETEGLKLRIYRHSRIDNDVVVHLLWNREEDPAKASHLGQRLASMLRERAMVEHSVWQGMESTSFTSEEPSNPRKRAS
jgi:hypothetical protein